MISGEKSKIVAVHLLNDFSGSPLIFMQALKGLQTAGHEIIVHTSKSREGFLGRLNAPFVYFPYLFFSNTLLRLFAFTASQLFLFFQLLRYRKEDVVIYVNTLLPFGAALAGACMGKKVVYHVHESYIRPALLKNFLRYIAAKTADTVLYVSHYLMNEERIKGVKGQVIYNALPDEFTEQAGKFKYHAVAGNSFNVLMICSLKNYKGVPEYLQLAKRHPGIHFELVLNASSKNIEDYFRKLEVPDNLHLFPVQKDLDPFYRRAGLVMNLTNPELCIETFGMTILEAMCYGIPVIAPPLGGPAELVESERNGFSIDVRDEATLDFRLEYLASNPEFLKQLSTGALETAKKFKSENFRNAVVQCVQGDKNL
ncbi:MAG: glycosyltransferase [Bacteroidetes bacterium]|nr:glycosyltransferase [Bacteroidota bacterium]